MVVADGVNVRSLRTDFSFTLVFVSRGRTRIVVDGRTGRTAVFVL